MKLILGFSIPLLFGNLFQQFYSMVDTMIVGRVLGTGPLAAVGSTGSITFLIIGFCLGLCSGFAIPVAQRFGSRDYKELRRFIGNAVWLCVGFGFVLTVLTVIFCRNILELMGTPADIIDDAYAYLVVIFAGIPATFLYNMLAGIQRPDSILRMGDIARQDVNGIYIGIPDHFFKVRTDLAAHSAKILSNLLCPPGVKVKN